MPTYGQSDAVAVEIVDALNNRSPNFCGGTLGVSAERKFARRLDFSDLSVIGENATVEVIPGDDLADLAGLDYIYDDTYGCHIVILQNVTDTTNGGLKESQMALLLRLRSEIIDWLCGSALSCPDAVHPFEGAQIFAVRHGNEGIYDLEKLEQLNIFYSDIIVTYKAVGIRRKNS